MSTDIYMFVSTVRWTTLWIGLPLRFLDLQELKTTLLPLWLCLHYHILLLIVACSFISLLFLIVNKNKNFSMFFSLKKIFYDIELREFNWKLIYVSLLNCATECCVWGPKYCVFFLNFGGYVKETKLICYSFLVDKFHIILSFIASWSLKCSIWSLNLKFIFIHFSYYYSFFGHSWSIPKH